MNSIQQIIAESTEKAKEEREIAEEEIQKANALTHVRELAETVRCFWPGRTTDPEYDVWDVPRTKPLSQKYWENFVGAIIDLCKAAKKLGFNGDLDVKSGDAEEFVSEIYRLAFSRQKKKPAELLCKIPKFDDDLCEQCDQLIRTEYPRRILVAVGAEETKGAPELANKDQIESSSISISNDDEYSGFFNADIKRMTGLENNALNDYREMASVPKAGVGKKNFRQTRSDLIKLLKTISDRSSNETIRETCRNSLDDLANIP